MFIPKLQHAITEQRERHIAAVLDLSLNNLDRKDPRKIAWLNSGHGIKAFMASCPSAKYWCSNEELAEIHALLMGLPSPACRPYINKIIKVGKKVRMDAHGKNLTTMQLAGGGWTARHDEIKWALHKRMKMARLGSICEVTNLFKTTLRQDAMEELNQVPRRERQGMVPDFMFTMGDGERILGDVKTMTTGDKYT